MFVTRRTSPANATLCILVRGDPTTRIYPILVSSAAFLNIQSTTQMKDNNTAASITKNGIYEYRVSFNIKRS
jgi:hypothetical protein